MNKPVGPLVERFCFRGFDPFFLRGSDSGDLKVYIVNRYLKGNHFYRKQFFYNFLNFDFS